jgi:predicted nucleotidyltransferase
MNSDEPPALDLRRLVAVLNQHGVDYVVVGGAAARAHGAVRPTRDFDCLVDRDDRDNLTRLTDAMRQLNARLVVEGMSDAAAAQLPVILDALTLENLEISTWRTDAGDLDILTSFPDRDGRRLTYHDVVISAAPGDLEGIAVRIAALDDVIASKEWANRPKDHEALPELRAIRDRSREPRREAEIDPHTRRTTPRDPGLER